MTAAPAPEQVRGGPLTRADHDQAPDDGHRHELVDGSMIVTPSPSAPHQSAVGTLYLLLRAACPSELKVLLAPFDVVLAEDTVLQPDLLVCRRSDLTRKELPAVPVLAVEVLSPSTRRIDLMLQRSVLEAAGCASYWLVDPDAPSITALELHEGAYVEVGRAEGTQPITLTAPYEVTVVPDELLD